MDVLLGIGEVTKSFGDEVVSLPTVQSRSPRSYSVTLLEVNFLLPLAISKMFREVLLDPSERDYHRFLRCTSSEIEGSAPTPTDTSI